mmetsp:Transcript_9483/g.24400  ORF Transcript_9483/g.24400 Transcript_9483/m.24400 type:complete len:250 (+) Transcript_9483:703-1452(+)
MHPQLQSPRTQQRPRTQKTAKEAPALHPEAACTFCSTPGSPRAPPARRCRAMRPQPSPHKRRQTRRRRHRLGAGDPQVGSRCPPEEDGRTLGSMAVAPRSPPAQPWPSACRACRNGTPPPSSLVTPAVGAAPEVHAAASGSPRSAAGRPRPTSARCGSRCAAAARGRPACRSPGSRHGRSRSRPRTAPRGSRPRTASTPSPSWPAAGCCRAPRARAPTSGSRPRPRCPWRSDSATRRRARRPCSAASGR